MEHHNDMTKKRTSLQDLQDKNLLGGQETSDSIKGAAGMSDKNRLLSEFQFGKILPS